MAESSAQKVLVIVSGEASSELAMKWARSGDLPNLDRLMRAGVAGTIEAPEPFVTAQLWGTLISGRTPGHHGLFDFMQRDTDGRFREIDGTALKTAPVWRLAEAAGRTAGTINLPFTYPPERLSGFMIAGQDAPGAHRSIAEPPTLYDEIVRTSGPYPLKSIFPGGREKADYLWLVERDCDRWVDVMGHVVDSRPCDLTMCYVGATAMAQHYFWGDMTDERPDNPYRDVVKSAFLGLDRLVGRLVEASGPDTTVFVVSECGAGPLASGVDVNAFLAQAGFLAFTPAAAKSDGGRRELFARLRFLAQSRLPVGVRTALLRTLRPLKGWLMNRFDGADIDWQRTRAFSRGEEGQIFINLRGRDPEGIVAPGAEYERLRAEIGAALLALRDPETGEPAVSSVHRREDVLHGPELDRAPDLLVHWRGGEYMPNESVRRSDQVFGTRWREGMAWPTSGSHRPAATFFAAGPMIAPGATLDGGRLIDLAPTWLHCLGITPPPELEGRVLHEILHPRPAPAVATDDRRIP
ncbi:alkaline phosphatase family protein [Oceanibacterium hippocampi]|uniref:Type I phosphodiesterase / nucleotide pyrophosphatase n=1 Tax=Oceanibacterium hippocampi TaxID=745714 RepID=A0A1Y5TH17_9PROT|nr:alkaline phosphatase family protein [Oceanibacterium hippocampi]SLN61870.1 Type I phosphodiesterase / nucleotide pyrophosphatase [Oceanibacterium hippocampi]